MHKIWNFKEFLKIKESVGERALKTLFLFQLDWLKLYLKVLK